MSKPVNPAVIGGFTIGALTLLIIGLLIFGVGQEFKSDKTKYVVYFSSSLNGLEIGAPVKLQGVKIGQVTEISLQLNTQEGVIYKPVVLEIDRKTLSYSGGGKLPQGQSIEKLKEGRDRLVELGMRARLEMQSLLTGLLYVDLNFYPDKPPVFANLNYNDLLEIPGIPKTTDELLTTAEEMASKIKHIPLEEIAHEFSESLKEIRTLLSSEETKRSRVALANTLEELNKTTKTLNENLKPMLKNTDLTVRNADRLVKNADSLVNETHGMVKKFNKALPKILKNTDRTLNAATSTLVKAEASLHVIDNTFGPESTLDDTLDSVKEAARSIRDLSDYLERHPESLLSGKD